MVGRNWGNFDDNVSPTNAISLRFDSIRFDTLVFYSRSRVVERTFLYQIISPHLEIEVRGFFEEYDIRTGNINDRKCDMKLQKCGTIHGTPVRRAVGTAACLVDLAVESGRHG